MTAIAENLEGGGRQTIRRRDPDRTQASILTARVDAIAA